MIHSCYHIITERIERIDDSLFRLSFEQAKQFTQTTHVTSHTVAKVDSTIKSGMAIGISNRFRIPIR